MPACWSPAIAACSPRRRSASRRCRRSGSGTTILAGQRTSRRVRAIELAPAYVDLAIARWRTLHPDLPVTLADDGREYDAVAAARMEVTADAA